MATEKTSEKKSPISEGTEQLRDLFYTGVGFAALAKEKVDDMVEDLRKQGKISKGDGERLVKDFVADTKNARDKFEKDVKSALTEVLEKAAYATKKELDNLKTRLEELEAKGKTAAEKKEKEVKEEVKEVVKDVKETVSTAAKKVEKAIA